MQTTHVKLTGYPAPDSQVREWFTYDTSKLGATQSDVRCSAFLTSLFEKTLITVNDPQRMKSAIMALPSLSDSEREAIQCDYPSTIQEQFHLFMTVGQRFSEQGSLRVKFYHSVVQRANEVGFWSYFISLLPC